MTTPKQKPVSPWELGCRVWSHASYAFICSYLCFCFALGPVSFPDLSLVCYQLCTVIHCYPSVHLPINTLLFHASLNSSHIYEFWTPCLRPSSVFPIHEWSCLCINAHLNDDFRTAHNETHAEFTHLCPDVSRSMVNSMKTICVRKLLRWIFSFPLVYLRYMFCNHAFPFIVLEVCPYTWVFTTHHLYFIHVPWLFTTAQWLFKCVNMQENGCLFLFFHVTTVAF